MRKQYQQMFNQIDISAEASGKIKHVLKLEQSADNLKVRKGMRIPKFAVVLASILLVSAVGVSAAYTFNLGDMFQGFYKNIFGDGVELTDSEKDIIENNAVVLDKSFYSKGVNLDFGGVLGDSGSAYVSYTLSLDKDYSEAVLNSVENARFYAMEEKTSHNLNHRVPLNTYSKIEFNNSALSQNGGYVLDRGGIDFSGETITAVITDKDSYVDTGVSLYDAFSKSGLTDSDYDISGTVKTDVFIPNRKLNLKLENVYGDSRLQTVGYKDGLLVVALQTNGYFDDFLQVFLRDKHTGEIISRCDGSTGSYNVNEKTSYVRFSVGPEADIKNYELVVVSEYAIELPMSYDTDEVEICKGNTVEMGDYNVTSATVSNISMQIKGKANLLGNDILKRVSLKLKDNTVIGYGDLSSFSQSDNGEFAAKIAFQNPIELADMESMFFSSESNTVEIPVN